MTTAKAEPLNTFEQFWEKFRDNHANKVKDLTHPESEIMFLVRCAVRDRDREYQTKVEWLKQELGIMEKKAYHDDNYDIVQHWIDVYAKIDQAFPDILKTDRRDDKKEGDG